MQFRLSGQKGIDATASRPPDLRYSKLHFILESTAGFKRQWLGDFLKNKNVLMIHFYHFIEGIPPTTAFDK